MAVDKDVSDAVADAVRQVVTELVFPRFDALRAEIWADIQRLERKLEERLEAREKLEIPALPLSPATRSRIPPLSDQGQAYVDALCTEVAQRLEQAAREWAERRAAEGLRK